MKKLLKPNDCVGKRIDRLFTDGPFIAIHFDDETAYVAQAISTSSITAVIEECMYISEHHVETLLLKTQSEIDAERAAAREKRRQEFLKLKAEFEPQ